MRPNGLLYMGVYGKDDFEGVWPQDEYVPKRFSRFIRMGYSESRGTIFEIEYFKLCHWKMMSGIFSR